MMCLARMIQLCFKSRNVSQERLPEPLGDVNICFGETFSLFIFPANCRALSATAGGCLVDGPKAEQQESEED